MTFDLLLSVIMLFTGIFLVGVLLCIILYKGDYKRFFASSLWTKTFFWIPIFAAFLALLYMQFWGAVITTLFIGAMAIKEVTMRKEKRWLASLYGFAVIFTMLHLPFYFTSFNGVLATSLLLVVGFSSVLSDVTAYFMGNFLGKHKLPWWINPNKAWEGVLGQLIGALIGFLLVSPLLPQSLPVLFACVIGVASALGDILNSIVKRKLSMKDWGSTIPGHGGVLDRFASLSFAIAATYWCAVILYG